MSANQALPNSSNTAWYTYNNKYFVPGNGISINLYLRRTLVRLAPYAAYIAANANGNTTKEIPLYGC
jgi:hypothetical protein